MKDYYYILGIERNASLEEIKTAHRKLSKKFHPDLNPNDSHSERLFKDIQEGYECLINNEKRISYDEAYNAWMSGKYQSAAQSESDNSFEFQKSRDFINKIQKNYFVFAVIVIAISTYFVSINDDRDNLEYAIAPVVAAIVYLYFLPVIIAWYQNHPYKKEIFIINIFCFIPAIFPFGWILLFIYSFNRVSSINAIFLLIIGLFAQHHHNKNEKN